MVHNPGFPPTEKQDIYLGVDRECYNKKTLHPASLSLTLTLSLPLSIFYSSFNYSNNFSFNEITNSEYSAPVMISTQINCECMLRVRVPYSSARLDRNGE